MKLTEGYKLTLSIKGRVIIKDAKGNNIELKNKKIQLLLSRNHRPSVLYYAVFLSSQDEDKAQSFIDAFIREGYRLKIKKRHVGKLAPMYIVYAGPFKSLKDVESRAPPGAVKVVKQIGNCRDIPVFFVIDGRKYTLYGKIKIQSTDNSTITLNNIELSNGLYESGKRSINLSSDLDIIPGFRGLTVISEIPIEEYIVGVVRSEIGEDAPMEAQKAQAVASRTNVIRKIWSGSGFEDYDITSTVYDQVYTGIGYSNHIERAVFETKGEILTYKGEPIEALFHAMCGGHTENSENVWSSYVPYLRGVFDKGKGHRKFSLKGEKTLKKWLDSSPNVNCKRYGKRYWRWEFVYNAFDLARILKVKTGRNIGKVLKIRVLERGISGRVKRIKIVGSKGSIVIRKDLEIRKALARSSLPSSLFYVKKRGEKFIFVGRGFGHGVGMCQIGAMGMADMGYNYREILKHYYSHVRVEKVY